jgi:hypothetical protein
MKQILWTQWILLLSFCCFLNSSIAQGWERTYGYNQRDAASDIQLTSDGGYIVSGYAYDTIGSDRNMYAIKLDHNGDTLWTKINGISTVTETASTGQETSDSLFFIAGTSSNYATGVSQMHFIKMDSNGDTLWTRKYSSSIQNGLDNVSCHAAIQTSDGGYILTGSDDYDAAIVKIDAIGDTLWTRTYGSSATEDRFLALKKTSDGGYIFAGDKSVPAFPIDNRQMYLVKTDANGDSLWTKLYGDATFPIAFDVSQTSDNGYILIGSSYSNSTTISVVKTDSLGNTLWENTYSGSIGASIKETSDGNYVLVGSSLSGYNLLIKINAIGTELWRKNYAFGSARQVHQTADGGYIFAGDTKPNHGGVNNNSINMYVVKTDSFGNSLPNYIRGHVFQDNNTDCLWNTGDVDLTGAIITAENNNNGRIYYGTTDAFGSYEINCAAGNYTVNINASSPYHSTTCSQSISSTLLLPAEVDTINFPLEPSLICPLLYVDLSAPFIRQTGNGSIYTVHYCNQGTMEAHNAYVKVELDPALTVLGSSIAISNQNNNIYTFLLGNLSIGQCASFTIDVIADTSAIMGQTFCSEAHIYPDSTCIPNLWNGPILDVEVDCINDTIHFEIQNIGNPMSQPLQYFVYEDNIIFSIGNTNPLGTFGTQTIKTAAGVGKSYRLSVNQLLGFPSILGDSVATASIEGCKPAPNGGFNTGFITQLSNGNSAPFIAVDCQQMVGSYDPNDKSAQPEGYNSTQHYIEAHTALDYKIRFQNTGTDTAFSVVLRDTISPYLDLSSLEMGASSHPYTWRIYGQRILEIKFSPIALPDSTTNELASHGFVRFRFNQESNNPIGTRIENTAGIYFDYNPPIITNTTWHTIGEDFVPITVSVDQIHAPNTKVTIFPNPFKQATNIVVEGAPYQALTLSVFDAMGRLVYNKQASGNSITLSRGHLSEGVYFYRLEGDQKLINTGKVMVQN